MGQAQSKKQQELVKKVSNYAEKLDSPPAKAYSEKELASLKKKFQEISGGKSEITKEQFYESFRDMPEALQPPALVADRYFSLFDTNGNGTIDWREFMNGLSLTVKGEVEDKIRFMFDLMDLDGSGTIEKDELMKITRSYMSNAMKVANAAFASVTEGIIEDEGERKTIESMMEEMAEAGVEMAVDLVFDLSDINQDGKISYEEYEKYVKSNPEAMTSITMLTELFTTLTGDPKKTETKTV